MNQMTLLIIQTSLRLPPEAFYAALLAAFVGIIAGALLASPLRKLLSKVYPAPEDRHKREASQPRRDAHGTGETPSPEQADRPGGEDDSAVAPTPPTPPQRSAADVTGTFRMIGASLAAPLTTLSRKLDELDPLLRESRGADEEFQARVDKCFTGLREELSSINQAVLGIPVAVRAAVGGYFEEEQRRKEEQQRLREEQFKRARDEEAKRRQDEAEQRKRELHKRFIDRLAELHTSDLMQTSLLTKRIADGLNNDQSEPARFEDLLPPYTRLIAAADDVRRELSRPDFFSGDDLDGAAARAEGKFKEVEAAREDLERKHKPLCLVDLLEKASGYQGLEESANNLRELLNLEEVPVSVGTEPEAQQMEELDVVARKGHGGRIIISEVLDKGYRLKETGAVVRKPRVVVSLEG